MYGVGVSQCGGGDQRTTLRSLFPPSTTYTPDLEKALRRNIARTCEVVQQVRGLTVRAKSLSDTQAPPGRVSQLSKVVL